MHHKQKNNNFPQILFVYFQNNWFLLLWKGISIPQIASEHTDTQNASLLPARAAQNARQTSENANLHNRTQTSKVYGCGASEFEGQGLWKNKACLLLKTSGHF